MVNAHIGECAIHLKGGRDIVFRPTFLRVAQLGSPEEILKVFNESQIPSDDGFKAAYRALVTFADNPDDIDDVIGYFYPALRNGKITFKYKAGLCPKEDLHVIGCKLMMDAVIGRPSERDKRKASGSAPAQEFDPAEFVGIAVAHLGGSNDEWWNSTMIEWYKAVKAKCPDKEEDDNMMSKEEQKALFDEIDRIKRQKKHG
ncbi:MAG: hypothetical protein KTR16_11580 [Acidiferrobacterales bacterium]|nr:hypothetical protein [Acidiferrobacterales bacterium]